MRTASSIQQVLRLRNKLKSPVGFVPTMGSLHEGHLSLVRRARNDSSSVIVSIFVNPSQFGPKEDYISYPRSLNRDKNVLKKEGVDLLFCPVAREMYPPGYDTWVNVDRFSDRLEGASRPGHFKGVTTVVLKFFNIVRPDVAYFGQKDAQQAIILRQMVRDLNIVTTIKVLPTVRDADGLAMSSRNLCLSPAQRQAAPVLYRALAAASRLVDEGHVDSRQVREAISATIFSEPLAAIDYISIADLSTLEEVKTMIAPCLISVAVWIGGIRLIDNIITGQNTLTAHGLP